MLSLLILLRWLQYHVVFVQMWATVRSFYILSDYTVFEPCASWEATPTLGSPSFMNIVTNANVDVQPCAGQCELLQCVEQCLANGDGGDKPFKEF